MRRSKARLSLAIAFAFVALPCFIGTPGALAVSGSITDVHSAGGRVAATYTTNYDLCTDSATCFWSSTAYYYRAAHKCTPNYRAELAYVGESHETSGSETKRDFFYPIYTGSIRICLYVDGLLGDTHFLAQALTRGRPPSPPGPARIAFNRACYRERSRVHMTGRGFERGDTLTVRHSLGPEDVIGANAGGRFAYNFFAPVISNQSTPKQRRVRVTVKGERYYDIPARSARGSFLVTTLAVATTPNLPSYGDIPRRVRYRLSGFKHGRPIYAHWRHNGHSSGHQRLGRAHGPCGELRSARLAFRERVDGPGRWEIQFDQHKSYSPRSEPKTWLEFRIVRTFLRLRTG